MFFISFPASLSHACIFNVRALHNFVGGDNFHQRILSVKEDIIHWFIVTGE